MRPLFAFFFVCLSFMAQSQVNYTANNQVTPYDGGYRAGVNPGYHGSNWTTQTLADISAGNPAAGAPGVGVRALRGTLPEWIAEQYGYFLWTPTYEYYNALGLEDNTCFVGFASDEHRDPNEYCPGTPTDMFANLYEPIWDNGENGTPVNDNNYYALYLYKVINAIGDHVKFWEIWNEPGFDFSGARGWLPPGTPGNWWENNPDPCDYKLRAPVYHYIRTLRISYEVIKTMSPDDYVVVAGVGYNSFLDVILRNTDNPVDGSVTPEFPLGGGAYFDVLGFHAYPHFDGSVRYWSSEINNFVYTRHSDAAIEGLLSSQAERQTILNQYGYDGNTHPQKLWTITEVNVPRAPFSEESFGSEELQVNYITKMVITAAQNDIVQTHVWDLGEEAYIEDANNEFDLMGLYEKLDDREPFDAEFTDEGIAYKTAADFIFETSFDQNRTNAMNLPSTIKGGAFKKVNGDYVYVLWAATNTDLSENAFANYSFPASFGINNLERKQWDFSQTNATSNVGANNIPLNGTPVFLTPNINNSTGELTLTCPDYEFEVGGTEQEGGAFVTWEEAFATTTCPSGGASVVTISDIPNGGFFPFGMTVVQYEATDNCGNKKECAMAIKVASTGGGLGDCHLFRYGFNYRGQYKGNKYLISLIDTTWAAAKEICESHGGRLAVIDDAEENRFIQNNITDIAYIGLGDYQSEGNLVWENGNSANYTNFDNCSWCQGNTAQNDYTQFHPWNGKWNFNDGTEELFFLMELPCSEQTGCTDNDGDGLCASEDCNDFNANLPAIAGTSCDDGNPETEDDVIQADGCTCEGTVITTGCNISYSNTANSITVNGAIGAHVRVRIFDSSWNILEECFDNCNNPQTFGGLSNGDYLIQIHIFDSNWMPVCDEVENISLSGQSCTDNDDDGICLAEDCDDNDSSIPTNPGTACDDGNPETNNDVIQADGCSCAGTPDTNSPCDIVYTVSGSSLTLNGGGMNSPHIKIRILAAGWNLVSECFDNCNNPHTFAGLAAGDYTLDILLMDVNWSETCTFREDFTVSGGPCTDNDNDGVCAAVDCDDNNNALPTTPGISCDDGDPETDDDVIQADGCTCVGTPQGGGGGSSQCGVNYSSSGNSITVSNWNAAHFKIKLLDGSWGPYFECIDNCNDPQVIGNLAPDSYRLFVKLFDESWTVTCEFEETIVIGAIQSLSKVEPQEPTTLIVPAQQKQSLVLFPNPVQNTLFVQSKSLVGKTVDLEIYNQFGRRVAAQHFDQLPANPVEIDLSEEQNGLYWMVIKSKDQKLKSARFILNRLY